MPALPSLNPGDIWGDDDHDFHSSFVDITTGRLQGPVLNVQSSEFGAVGDGVTNDTAAIQAAIDAAPSTGATVLCPAATYVVNGTLDMRDKSNLVLRGVGAARKIYAIAPVSGTVFKRASGTGTMLRVGSTTAQTDSQIKPGQWVRGISFDCAGLAATGVLVESLHGGGVTDVFILYPTSVGLDINTVDLSGVEDTQDNFFDHIAVNVAAGAAISGIGVRLGSHAAGGGNTSINTFGKLMIYHANGVGLQLNDCDANTFENILINRAGGGSGIGAELSGSGMAFSGHCRQNLIGFIQPGAGGLTARATALTQASGPNGIACYSTGNSSPVPTVESGATLFWNHITNGPQNITFQNNQSFYARRADNTADDGVWAYNTLNEMHVLQPLRTSSITVATGSNVNFATSGSGTKIGSDTAQKIAFWNATPAAQQVLATGAGKTADNIISFLQSIGLCRQS